MVKELDELKKNKARLTAQVEALQLKINNLPCTCQLHKESFCTYAHPPQPQQQAHTPYNNNQDHRHYRSLPYQLKCEESPVASSVEYQKSPPTPKPFEDTQSLGYFHHFSQQHQIVSGGYDNPNNYYQHQFGPSPVANSRPNGFYYHPYFRK
jgi:hypothetical protein